MKYLALPPIQKKPFRMVYSMITPPKKVYGEKGFVYYTINDLEDLGSYEISESNFGVIAPEQLHHVELMTKDTVFHIEFMK